KVDLDDYYNLGIALCSLTDETKLTQKCKADDTAALYYLKKVADTYTHDKSHYAKHMQAKAAFLIARLYELDENKEENKKILPIESDGAKRYYEKAQRLGYPQASYKLGEYCYQKKMYDAAYKSFAYYVNQKT